MPDVELTQPDVKHMKWWGWGDDAHAFTLEGKPRLPAFIKFAIDIDTDTAQPQGAPDFDSLPKPPARIGEGLRGVLIEALGADNVLTDDMERVVHSFGKSVRDLIRVRRGEFGRLVDLVVYPGDEAQVEAVLGIAREHDAVLIPFGGGSNIVGSLNPDPAEERTIISLDLGRMARVLSIDEESGLARIQAGVLGPDMEQQLNARGWTMGHQPDSFAWSTLGGWVATRSTGMQSDKYGDIADIVRGMRVVQPGRVLVIKPQPSQSNGPSLREMLLGSEGRLGIITECTVNVHRKPKKREIIAYLFPTWDAGLAAMREISESDAKPSVTRVSDAYETAFTFATKKASKPGLKKKIETGMFEVLKKRGWDMDQACLSFIGHEGSASHVAYERQLVTRIIARHGGIPLGKGPGELYDQKKYDTPYIRDFLLDLGAVADVSESPAHWANLKRLWTTARAAAEQGFAEAGVKGYIFCHLSHSYHSGACLYFTFALRGDDMPEARYDMVKNRIQQALVDVGSTVSHHHAVGIEHKPWIGQDLTPEGCAMLSEVFSAIDPGRNLNPGKIVD